MSRTKLFVSELLLDEALESIALEKLEDIDVIPYSPEARSGTDVARMISDNLGDEDGSDTVCFVGSEWVPLEAVPPLNIGSVHFVEARNNCELIAGKTWTDQMLGQGAFIVYPGLLRRLKELKDFEHPGEVTKKIVLLDTGCCPGIDKSLEDAAAELKLPFETIKVGLDTFRSNISNGVLMARLKKEAESVMIADRSEARIRADYALVFDLFQEISRESDEKKVVDAFLHIMDVLFAPEKIEYYSIDEEGSFHYFGGGDAPSIEEIEKRDLRSVSNGYDGTIRGFRLRIENRGVLIGVLIVKDIAFPGFWKQYSNLGIQMAPVFGLAVANTRYIHDINESEKKIKGALALERTALDISNLFIGQVDIDDALPRSLKRIGIATNSDRASYFQISNEFIDVSKTYGWINEQTHALPTITRPIPLSQLSWLMKRMTEAGEVRIEDLADTPTDVREQMRPFIEASIRSIMFVPVIVDGHIYGILALQDVKGPRKWDDDHAAMLRFLGTTLNKTMQELRSEENVAGLNESLIVTNKVLRHDIKNELLVVNGSLELYSRKNEKRNLDRAFSSLIKIQNLIEQFKQLDAFLLSGKGLFPCHLAETINNAMMAYQMHYQINNDATVMADFALTSVIDNLARNAKMHGKAENMVFDVRITGPLIELSVGDDGIGIPAEIRNDLFKEGFSYGENKSTGLGLYLIKKTMERYGGWVTVEENEPKGAKFVLHFPSGSIPPDRVNSGSRGA